MKKSKIIAIFAAASMAAFTFAGCAEKPSDTDVVTSQQETVSETAAVSETEKLFEMSPMRNIPSTELVKEMRVGWNLGNTLDATISSPKGTETPEDWEKAWGQPVTTQTMIDHISGQGFNVLRLPVTWEGKFGPAPDYTIDPAWLSRVNEIVDYAYKNDMFVILNCHHEEWNYPSYEKEEEATAILKALWSQISEHFADYNEKLIFEGMNEPRLKNTPMEWNGGNEEARDVINHWNAAFIDTVRKSGGNNADRHLMIPTYAASTSDNVLADFIVPDDDKVIVSVHAYLPYRFALADADQAVKEWSADNTADTNDINTLMEKLTELYVKEGHAVIIGEMGTRNRMNTAARAECARYYSKAAHDAGIPICWWDNNAFVGSGENFGLFDRSTFEWRYPTINQALMEPFGQ